MNQQDFQQALLDEAKNRGFSAAEVYIAGSRGLEVRVFSGKISHYESSQQQGVSFRGQIHGKMGYAFSEKLEPDVVSWLLDEAAANAEVLSDTENEDLFAGAPWEPTRSYSESLAQVPPQALIDAATLLESSALEADKRIRAVEYAVCEYGEASRLIANTLGLRVEEKSNMMVAFSLARASEQDFLKRGFEIWQGRDFTRLDAARIGREAAQKATDMLGARSIKSGTYCVVLDKEAAASLLKTFLPVFFGDKVQQGFSMLGSKVNQPVASPAVSLVDEARCADSLYQPAFDSEGVPTARTSLIENGVLQGFLHSRKTAAKAGISSTGNGFKPSWKAGIQVSATNSYLAPGQQSCETLLSEMGQGLHITELTGLHAGTNMVSGDFSLSAEGFFIENGTRAFPVDQITVAGNFYDVLRQIQKTGNDLYFGMPGGSQVGSPSLLIESLSISGQ